MMFDNVYHYYSHFIGKEMEPQGSEVTCPGYTAVEWWSQDYELGSLGASSLL